MISLDTLCRCLQALDTLPLLAQEKYPVWGIHFEFHKFLVVSLCIYFGDMALDMKAFLETVKGAEVQGRVDKALAILTRVKIFFA